MPANTKPIVHDNEVALRWLASEGAYVRDLRIMAGLTQAELVDRVGFGSKQALSAVETGHRHVPPDRIHRLADVLDVDLARFSQRLLRTQNAWIYAGLFGADARLAAELRLASRP